jgi:ketosteroid isomerase-like protein
MASAAEVVATINAAWRTGRTEGLATHFDPDIVIVGPEYRPLARGVEACLASYRDFLRVSVIHDYRQADVSVHEAGGVAVVTYTWEMDYEQGGRRSRETGTDLFVLRREGEQWLAVWRAVTFSPVGDPAG